MELNWRWGALAGAAAFLISLFFGVLAGVFFGTLVLRALIGGIFFSVIGMACSMLVHRFLPELVEVAGKQTAADVTGESVDIVIQDEAGEAGDGDEYSDLDRSRSSGDRDSLVEEVEESSVVETSGEASRGESAGFRIDAEPVAAGAAEVAVEVAEIDELPDLDRFSGSFVPERFPEPGAAKAGPAGSAGSGSPTEKNPQLLARGIQTLLKKDQEG
jgi:hypothetical protein